MGIASLFKSSRKNTPADLSQLVVDLHSHLLPGIDDGSKSMDHTLGMLLKFEELGYKKVITTPHVMHGFYDNTAAIILEKLEDVRAAIRQAGLTIEIDASAEYYYDETLFE